MIPRPLAASLAGLLLAAPCWGAAAAAPRNPGVVEIEKPEAYGRVLAMSDAHGMYDNLVPLLRSAGIIDDENRWAAGNALLIIVGDSIDKGPKTLEVLDLYIALSAQAQAAGGRLVHLLGNHEAEFMADPANPKAKTLLAELKAQGVAVKDFLDPAQPRGAFLRSMPAAARVGKWLFCHAGLMPAMTWADFTAKAAGVAGAGSYGDDFLIGADSLLEARKWWQDPADNERQLDADGLFGVVFGHQPSALGVQGAVAMTSDGRVIKIDTGMAPDAGAHVGEVLQFSTPAQLNAAAPAQATVLPSGRAPTPADPAAAMKAVSSP